MAVAGSYISLAEAQNLTRTDDLIAGLVEEVVREGGILDILPTRTVRGTQLAYVRENVLPSGAFHSIADSWVATEDIDVTKVTLSLAIHGDQKNIDEFVKRTYSEPNDHQAIIMAQTMKGLKIKIETALMYESAAFSGFHSLVTSNQTQSMGTGANGAALTVTKLNRAIDLVRPVSAKKYAVMPFQIAQRLDQASQGVNSVPLSYVDAKMGMSSGFRTAYWRDAEIKRNDYLATADTGALQETIANGVYSAQTGGATGSIFLMHPGLPENGEIGGVFLAIGEELFRVEGPHPHPDKDAEWVRITSYLAPGLAGTRGLAIVDGITDAAVTA